MGDAVVAINPRPGDSSPLGDIRSFIRNVQQRSWTPQFGRLEQGAALRWQERGDVKQ